MLEINIEELVARTFIRQINLQLSPPYHISLHELYNNGIYYGFPIKQSNSCRLATISEFYEGVKDLVNRDSRFSKSVFNDTEYLCLSPSISIAELETLITT